MPRNSIVGSLFPPKGLPEVPLGASWVVFGVSLGHPWPLLGSPAAALCPLWSHPGPHFGVKNPPFSIPRALRNDFSSILAVLASIWGSWAPFFHNFCNFFITCLLRMSKLPHCQAHVENPTAHASRKRTLRGGLGVAPRINYSKIIQNESPNHSKFISEFSKEISKEISKASSKHHSCTTSAPHFCQILAECSPIQYNTI